MIFYVYNEEFQMANLDDKIAELLDIEGALCAAVVDSKNGMVMANAGAGIDIEIAAAGNTDVLRAKMKTIDLLKLNDKIDDILITLGKQYHVIRPLQSVEGAFIYLVLDTKNANLALARRKVNDFDATIESL